MTGVVVTGVGVVSGLGVGVEPFLAGLRSNTVVIDRAPWLTEDEAGWWACIPGFDPLEHMDERVVAGTDLFAQFAIVAADEAVRDAGLEGALDERRTAVVHGTSMGGMSAMQRASHALATGGPETMDRKTLIKIWPNMAAAQLAMRYGLHGPTYTVCTACAASNDAIGIAAQMIAAGRVDVAIAGGTEGGFQLAGTPPDGFVPINFVGQNLYGMQSQTRDRLDVMKPFDAHRSGLVTGDGSAALILESSEHAAARGARPMAEIAGYASLADGYHPSSPEPTGRWEQLVMEEALADAGAEASDVDALFAHATATPKGDMAEITAINAVHGGRDLPVTSLKGHIGHTGASSAAMAAISGITAMHEGWFPNIAGTTEPDPAARFRIVTGEPLELRPEVVQVNAFGFGGQNSSLVLRAA